VCAKWSSSDGFSHDPRANITGDTSPEVFGITVVFDLLSFPEQITTDPDPIAGLNRFTRELFSEMTVITLDETSSVWKPTDKKPAIYWRFEGTAATDKQSFAVNWYMGEFAAHVIAESVAERNRWTKAIIEQIQLHGEIVLLDGSPMFAKQVKIRHNADPLREGQFSLTGMYGVLASREKLPAQIPINHAALTHEHTRLEVQTNGK
jgi:hypothetical protein